ncbi:MAG: transporter [Xanthobacteraceae bacterium]
MTIKPNGPMRGLAALILPVAVAAVTVTVSQETSRADEGGVSFWIPGQFGSLAAAPAQPGWAFATIGYYTDIRASGEVAAARQITLGRFSPTVNVDLNATLRARVPADFVNVNYVFATPVLGGQLAMGMTGAFGRPTTSIDGVLTASIGGLTATRTGSISDSRFGWGDLYPMASLRWNHGIHNFMVYGTGDIPVGTYDPSNLANLGIGHGAADAGIGYTYFNPATGHEFSVVTGATYNLKNTQTDYQNGIDWHLDWGASKFLSKQLFVGAVGYAYQQLTPDKGQSPLLGEFKSRVFGVGPQIGYLFPVFDMQGYLNLKGYAEFEAQNRPSGWNAWVTLAISPAAEPPPTAKPRIPLK